jgi:8-oxo-dGTP pyrophosphatase MutT (NUDIX family)
MDLASLPAKRCLTACGFLIQQNKILLVLHKKLKLWLAPGGHVDEDELPHLAAEREVLEETGITVKALSAYPVPTGHESQYLPLPFSINLHWINRHLYEQRLAAHSLKRQATTMWPLGCEQHWVMTYLVKPVNGVAFKANTEETDAIRWFLESEIDSLDTTIDIKQEIHLAFTLSNSGTIPS